MGAHQIAFEADEVHSHRDCAAGVPAESFNPVHQVGAELVASFQNAQHHNVVVPEVVHDVSGQTLCPATQHEKQTFCHIVPIKETLNPILNFY